MEIQDYKSSLDNAASRKYGTFSYLPEMDESRLRALVEYLIKKRWTPAIEHVEVERAGDDYWYMWKLPLFGERDARRILDEVESCKAAYPTHLVRLIGYDNIRQTQGTCVVLHRHD